MGVLTGPHVGHLAERNGVFVGKDLVVRTQVAGHVGVVHGAVLKRLGGHAAARNADGSPLSDDTITGLLLTLLFAGQHTSAVLATWTGVLLLQNHHMLAPLLAEQAAMGRLSGLLDVRRR